VVCRRFGTSAETTGFTAILSRLGVNSKLKRAKSSAVVESSLCAIDVRQE
jgi:hypothetical protein